MKKFNELIFWFALTLTIILTPLLFSGCTRGESVDNYNNDNPEIEYLIKQTNFKFNTVDDHLFEIGFGYKKPVSKSYSDSLVYDYIDKYTTYTASEFYFDRAPLYDTLSWLDLNPDHKFRIYLDSIGYIKL